MNLVTLDFETYFSKEYSLSRMTTEEYVRDSRFAVHCCGVKVNDAPAAIASFDPANCAFVAHHAAFDGLILAHHYNSRPVFWFDTLSMARAAFPRLKSHSLSALAAHFGLPEKTVPYNEFRGKRHLSPEVQARLEAGCRHDVELTHSIFKLLLPLVPREELDIIDLTIRLFTEPVLRLDAPRLQRHYEEVKEKKRGILAQLGVSKETLQSSDKFAALLLQLGVDPPTKASPTNPERRIYAFSKTDEAMKKLLEHEDETVALLASARLGEKSTIAETRCARLLSMHERGALPVYLNYGGAHTMRWSGGDKMNWQNFPRGSEIRLSIKAPEGSVIVVGDLSQIECRMLNWLAGQESVLQAFRENRDLYSEGASRFYGREITRKDKIERHLGKTLELGCGYGMGWSKLQLTCRRGALGGPPIHLEESEARKAIYVYRSSHEHVKQLWETAEEQLLPVLYHRAETTLRCLTLRDGRIYLPNGLFLDYGGLEWVVNPYKNKPGWRLNGRRGHTYIYGAKLVENVVQALSRVVLSQAMLRIKKRYRIVMTTHDEIAVVAPEAEGQHALDFVLAEMKVPPAWCPEIPLDAEGGYDVRYSK